MQFWQARSSAGHPPRKIPCTFFFLASVRSSSLGIRRHLPVRRHKTHLRVALETNLVLIINFILGLPSFLSCNLFYAETFSKREFVFKRKGLGIFWNFVQCQTVQFDIVPLDGAISHIPKELSSILVLLGFNLIWCTRWWRWWYHNRCQE